MNHWTIPPECQGQIAQVSYRMGLEAGYKRILDQSDMTVSYYYSLAAFEAPESDWEPWNCEPEFGDWQECEEPGEEEFAEYYED
jgi:hypothetical protein